MDLHNDHNALDVFCRVFDGKSRDPKDIMVAIQVCVSCANSGQCTAINKHADQIDRFLSMLTTKEEPGG